MPDPYIGAELQGRYRIVERIAEGGMGVVYRAEHLGLERQVAVKFLHESVVADKELRRRFEVEAKAASRVSHPNCLGVVDFGIHRKVPYLVMDYVEGVTLRVVIDRSAISVERAINLSTQVLAGLGHAHKHGIVHRDVKPENVIVFSDERSEHVKILDFGLAKLTSAATITDGVAVGTPSYMSPEQTRGERADRRSDVYGAGVLLFELLTGKKPFVAATPFDTMKMHREAPVPSFASVAPDRVIAPEVETVVRKALAKEPDDRYPTAIELASALDRIVPHREPVFAVIEEAPERERPARWPWFVAGLGASLLVVVVALVVIPDDNELPAPSVAPDAAVVAPIPDAGSGSGMAPPPEIPGVAEALALARRGREAQAAVALEQLRVKHPTSAHVMYAIGNLNALRAWWGPAMTAYTDALKKHPAYRTDARLIRDVVQALGSDKGYTQALNLILHTIGHAADAELDAASRASDQSLRYRSRDVQKKLANKK
jgi:serine/threonine-protein kinase